MAVMESSPEPPRLTNVVGLSTLSDIRKACELDQKRIIASMQLTRSMEDWIALKSPRSAIIDEEEEEGDANSRKKLVPARSFSFLKPRWSKVVDRKVCVDECILSLEQAFLAHSAAFDLDGDGTICVEELILIFDRCALFDELFTPNKVRNYFSTWADGCNHIQGRNATLQDDGIGFQAFQTVLRWGADIKGVDFARCAEKVVRLSRKLCDKSSSVQRRLEVVFDAFCKKNPTRMSAFEFGTLCGKVGIYDENKFTMADVYSLFYKISGVVHGEGVDFEGFVSVLNEIGTRLDLEQHDEVFEMFAKAVEILDTDEETITRVRMRLRHAAGIVGGSDWRHFFRNLGHKQGVLGWDDFLELCRDKLHLADRDNHLRILFDKLDEDGSGELDIDDFIHFIGE